MRADKVTLDHLSRGRPILPVGLGAAEDDAGFYKVGEAMDLIAEHDSQPPPFDIVMEGETPGDNREQAVSIVRPWAEVGVTWWLESMWGEHVRLDDVQTRIRQGPPHIEE